MELLVKDLPSLKTIIPTIFDFAANRKKWCFYGEVGAGKTTLIKEIAAHLGIQDAVTSPTYSLINEYEYTNGTTTQPVYAYHMDLYRLKVFEEALDIGIEDYLADSAYCFIEWPELIEGILPEDYLKISIEIVKDSVRKIVLL